MAHYVAECISDTRKARGKTAAEASERCQRAILALWAHRAELPNGIRPLAAIEPLLAVLQALDPDQHQPFFHRRIWDSIEARDSSDCDDDLAVIRQVDRGARLLVGALLREVAERATDSTKAWIDIATLAGIDDRADIRLIVRLTAKDEADAVSERQAHLRPLREKREALAVLSARASALAQRYQLEIDRIEGEAHSPPHTDSDT